MKIEISRSGGNIYVAEIEDFEILNGAEIFIGRSDNCHLVLDDQTLSRKHAKIFYLDGTLYIESLSPYKQIEINGIEHSRKELSLGDKLQVGDYTLILKEWAYQTNRRDGEQLQENSSDEDKTQVLSADETVILSEEKDLSASDQEYPDVEEVNDSLDSEEPNKEDNEFSQDNEDFSDNESFSDEEDQFGDNSFEENSEEDSFGDDGFADDGFGDDGFGDDSGGDATQVFQGFAHYSLKLIGELAPVDRFQLENEEISIGRNSEKCAIVLNDPEVSGIHAKIKKTLINVTIEDCDSANGTLLNGERVNKAELKAGDIFEIGSTKFELQVSSELLESEESRLMPVDDNQVVEVEEVIEEEVDFSQMENALGGGEEEKEKSIIKRIWKNPEQRKKLIYGLVVLMGLWLMLEDDEVADTTANTPKKEKIEKSVGKNNPKKIKKQHDPKTLETLEENYLLGEAKYESGEYYEAKEHLDIVNSIDSEYKNVQTLLTLVKEGFEKKLRLKAEEEAEKERKKRQLAVQKLIVKARKEVKARNVVVAESLFAQVLEIDPENIDIPQLKLELDAYKEKQKKIALEKKRKEALRKSMIDALAPGKKLYLKEQWFPAINELEKFNAKKDMDEDLVKEATKMLRESRVNLNGIIEPLLGKARAYREGQDYKRAYETYGNILKHDPSNEEALNQRDGILERLNLNSRKIYREALISESLSLFEEAKEKYQQVQQISPINSEYYNKATEKLKNYTE